MTDEDNNQQYQVSSKTAFDGKVRIYRIDLCDIEQSTKDNNEDRVQAILTESRCTFSNILEKALDELNIVQVTLKLEGSRDEHDYDTLTFDATKLLSLNEVELNIDKFLEAAETKIIGQFRKYEFKDNGSIHFHYLRLYIHKVDFDDSIKPFDDISFKSAVEEALQTAPDEYDTSSVSFVMDGIDNPVQLDDIPMIEEKNEFSINVYMKKPNTDEIVGPVYHTQRRKKLHINLLLNNENGLNRYRSIKCFDSSDTTGYFCDGCFSSFREKKTLEHHQTEECLKVKTMLEQNTVKFIDKGYTKKLPFVVYAHFETLESQVDVNLRETTETKRRNRVWVRNTHKHLPYSYGYYIKCIGDNFSKSRISCREQSHECIKNFTENLVNDLKQLWSNYQKENTEASIKYIPVILMNLDKNGNFLMNGAKFDTYLIRLKKYFAVQKKLNIGDGANGVYMRFLDFSSFIQGALEDAVESIKEVGFKDMPHLELEEAVKQLLAEGDILFPHKNVKSLNDLNKTSFPESNNWHDINDHQYNHALRVWESLPNTNRSIAKYLEEYIKGKIFLLANVIENLRTFSMKNYGLDPAHYFSIASFGWAAMLKMTGEELELLPEKEMLNFVKKGIRGGYVQCNQRHVVANNKYLRESFKEEEMKSYVLYLDANNLGGYVMSKYLPYGEFEWVDHQSINYDVPADSDVGYILEVDLSYPVTYHDLHSDLPFCPEKKKMYGADCVADLYHKSRYIIYHSYLSLCVKHGLIVKDIYRVLKFKQKPWLEDYIKFNTAKRKEATTKCDKNLFKLLNNCIYGKTMENPDNSGNVQLFHKYENTGTKGNAYSALSRPDCSNYAICSESTVAVQFKNTSVVFKSPLHVGVCILDLAKTHMYKFHYDFMKEKVRDIRLLYTDNDSLMYLFKEEDCYEFIKKYVSDTTELEELRTGFDTSDYASDNQYGIPQKNRKEPGFFKDELDGGILKEFVGLKPKVYAISCKNNSDELEKKMKATKVPTNVRENFEIKNYVQCVTKNEPLYKIYPRIDTVDRDVYTQRVRRMVLSPNDPKRYVLQNRIDTLPLGHYKIV